MSKPPPALPKAPRLHRFGNRQRWGVHWYDIQGVRRFATFGWADDTSATLARRRYEAWKATEYHDLFHARASATVTVATIAGRFLRHACQTYVKAGKRTSHVWNVRQAMRDWRNMHGEEAAEDYTAPKLADLRNAMIYGADGKPRNYRTVNDRMRLVVAAMGWARERDLIPAGIVEDLRTVQGLRKGRSRATSGAKVRPPQKRVIEMVLAELPAAARAVIEIMGLTGMRPGEAVSMRPCDLSYVTFGKQRLMAYRPEHHKTEHMEGERERVIFIGPKGIALLEPFMASRPVTAPMFSPREAQAERLKRRREGRKTPLYLSHLNRRTYKPAEAVGDAYTTETLRRAVHYACRKLGVSRVNPNQLRHHVATELTKRFGIEAASVTLGHADLATTQIYAEPDVTKAMQAAAEVG